MIVTGDDAKSLFTNLRNKYSRDKKKIESKKVSGAGAEEVKEAVKETSEIFPFLQWLEPYIQPRRTVSNFVDADVEEVNEGQGTEEESRPITSASEISENSDPSTSRASKSTARYCT